MSSLRRLSVAVVLTAAVALAAGGQLRAEHGNPWLEPWPSMSIDAERPLAPTNTRVVLVSENGPATDVHQTEPVELVDDARGERIALRRAYTWLGPDADGYGDSLVIFEPERALEPDTFYALEFAGRRLETAWSSVHPGRNPGARSRPLTLGVQTGAGPDERAPVWRGAPQLEREADVAEVANEDTGGAVTFSEVPIERVRLTVDAEDDDGGPVLFRIDAYPLQGERARVAVVALDSPGDCRELAFFGEAELRAFADPDDSLYRYELEPLAPWEAKLTLEAIDQAGNRSQAELDKRPRVMLGGHHELWLCRAGSSEP